jgi:hypothetical protein
MFQNMRADSIGESTILEWQMMGIRNNEWAINHKVATTLAIIPAGIAVEQHIGAGVRIVAAPDFKDETSRRRIASLSHRSSDGLPPVSRNVVQTATSQFSVLSSWFLVLSSNRRR